MKRYRSQSLGLQLDNWTLISRFNIRFSVSSERRFDNFHSEIRLKTSNAEAKEVLRGKEEVAMIAGGESYNNLGHACVSKSMFFVVKTLESITKGNLSLRRLQFVCRINRKQLSLIPTLQVQFQLWTFAEGFLFVGKFGELSEGLRLRKIAFIAKTMPSLSAPNNIRRNL